MTSRVYVIGDVHGHYEKLRRLLSAAGLTGRDGAWAGDTATLWFTGDFFDRGPDGFASLDLVMRLQRQAAAAGGRVAALLGNHELMVLSVLRLRRHPCSLPGGSFEDDWLLNGGKLDDLERLTPEHVSWIERLPAMAHVGRTLLVHADARLYTGHGRTVGEVNRRLGRLITDPGAGAQAWDRLLTEFYERDAFPSAREAQAFLEIYGGQQIVHGHSPISRKGGAPESVTGPLVYAGGLCINVDGGMFLGGPGFVYELNTANAG